MKRFFLSAALGLGLLAPAFAQVNVVPQVGLNTSNLRQATYSAVSLGLVPAASGTDIFCISGSSTKAISIRRIAISGTAGTLVSLPFTLLRRTSVDTGGTAATTTAAPVATPHLSSDPAATATLIAYTANPTIVDSSPLYLHTSVLTLPVTTAGTSINGINWVAGTPVDAYSRGYDIPSGSTAQQYCVNVNAVSVSSGLLNIAITWVEQ